MFRRTQTNRHVISISIFIVTGYLGVTACAAGEYQAVCFEAGKTPQTLRLRSIDIETALKSLTLLTSQDSSLTVTNVRTLTGICQSEAVGFELSKIYFRNGFSSSWNQSGLLSEMQISAPSPWFSVIGASDPHPKWNAGEFVMASLVETRLVGTTKTRTFVGVWKGATRSTVGTFSQSPDGSYTQPVELLTSDLPLRSISYFPAIDTPAGTVGLLQEGTNELRLISALWGHPLKH